VSERVSVPTSQAGEPSTPDEIAHWLAANSPTTVEAPSYGPDIADDRDLRLCGDVRAKRVLDLGCGSGGNAVWFARAGAKVTAVDPSGLAVRHARQLADQHELKVEFRQGDLTDVSFLTPSTVDLVFAGSGQVAQVEDLARLLRQLHRVMRPDAALVLALPHPFNAVLGDDGALDTTYGVADRAMRTLSGDGGSVRVRLELRTMSELLTALARANFRVDAVHEPLPDPSAPRSARWRPVDALVPPTLVVRARKVGT
jgi:SAM-dependent methyltransferase